MVWYGIKTLPQQQPILKESSSPEEPTPKEDSKDHEPSFEEEVHHEDIHVDKMQLKEESELQVNHMLPSSKVPLMLLPPQCEDFQRGAYILEFEDSTARSS